MPRRQAAPSATAFGRTRGRWTGSRTTASTPTPSASLGACGQTARAFKDRDTRRFFEGRRIATFQGFNDQAARSLTLLDSAETLGDLAVLPDHRLESLRGARAGQHSIRTTSSGGLLPLDRGRDVRRGVRGLSTRGDGEERAALPKAHPRKRTATASRRPPCSHLAAVFRPAARCRPPRRRRRVGVPRCGDRSPPDALPPPCTSPCTPRSRRAMRAEVLPVCRGACSTK